MNFVALLHANIFEDQLAILFFLPIVEYSVRISHPSHRWVTPPVAKGPGTTSLQKEATFYRFKRAQKTGEDSLHPVTTAS